MDSLIRTPPARIAAAVIALGAVAFIDAPPARADRPGPMRPSAFAVTMRMGYEWRSGDATDFESPIEGGVEWLNDAARSDGRRVALVWGAGGQLGCGVVSLVGDFILVPFVQVPAGEFDPYMKTATIDGHVMVGVGARLGPVDVAPRLALGFDTQYVDRGWGTHAHPYAAAVLDGSVAFGDSWIIAEAWLMKRAQREDRLSARVGFPVEESGIAWMEVELRWEKVEGSTYDANLWLLGARMGF